jgi:putative sigma-54 modulation protein
VFVDVNGPKGGPDKVCRMTVLLAGLDRVAITEYGPNLFVMVDRVADRVKRRVSSALERARRFDQTRSIRTAESS